ncbi:HD-GYP domain-containing protein [Pseudodesulfovibrio tunisiensis]|uniref:HD-GYP domain-containing protein n=1 Tax=Pseudodesulfovibrio tunisiensis TaxID=463192 RepID=UPI001FB3DC5A|nr:HD-GYP domain-containing protein [Pseudodesulfovibrio tunisiensis]
MVSPDMPEYRISVDQLRPGVFIRLERARWFDHPFLFNSFKIRDDKQIALLRQLGVTELICIPEKSDVLPLAPKERKPAPTTPPISDQDIEALWDEKRERTRRLQEKKQRIAECEGRYAECLAAFSSILKGLVRGDAHSVDQALAFVDRLTDNFLHDTESTLHLMNVMDPGERVYSHPLNVAVLSMMTGRLAGLDRDELVCLGMGALFHDIGKERLERKLLRKRGPLTRPEQDLVERHPEYGADMMRAIPAFPEQALPAVAQHHERMDGSGYPMGLKADGIDRLARITAIADAYDNLCNSPDPDDSLTPYLALSYMFGQQKHLFDVELLALFIRCLGVYPPGTVVQLSNGAIGMVMAVNPQNQLRPSVVLYDSEVPKKEALIVDLADGDDLRVEKSIRPKHLPPEIFQYLSPRSRISYFVNQN